jgi:hypothetical protein
MKPSIILLCDPRGKVWRQFFCVVSQKAKRKIIIVVAINRGKMSAKCGTDVYLGYDPITGN